MTTQGSSSSGSGSHDHDHHYHHHHHSDCDCQPSASDNRAGGSYIATSDGCVTPKGPEMNGEELSEDNTIYNEASIHDFEFDEYLDEAYNREMYDADNDGDVMTSLPKALIVTGLDSAIFEDPDYKNEFENMFRTFDGRAIFQYLKSFHRARVVFSSSLQAASARIHLHETQLRDSLVKCYIAQPTKVMGSNRHLEPPKPVRQHLISPPSSPPVGWEPAREAQPSINYDLLTAVTALSPGESHELHPPTENQPGIVVHICEEAEGFPKQGKQKIVPTMCPKH
ncbi:calcipressin-3-like [Argonauta hians]